MNNIPRKRNQFLVGTIVTIICLLVIALTFVLISNLNKSIPSDSIQAEYAIDVNNPAAVVGEGDYVFVGKVSKEIGTKYENYVPKEHSDGSITFIGTAYTNYQVLVIDNIKNALITDEPITISKKGGIREDGSAYDIFEDDELPEAGKYYIFIANTQSDGTLLVSGANSNILIDEPSNKLQTVEAIEQTEEFKIYKDAVNNAEYFDEDILSSKYDDSK
jgi:hypothetical protein